MIFTTVLLLTLTFLNYHGQLKMIQVQDLVKNVPKDKVTGTWTFIGSNYVHSFENVSFGIHGAGKKHNNAKQSWKWTLSGTDTMGNRNHFKLRHMEEDPTQIRERLYADILHAMGTYANEATMVRLRYY
ncbi:hypothetical protein G6F68_015228 [Rhizopus microsporus]|nr:hypothetical protein G6F68_015228 [Rhizopus microsporus]